MLATSNHSWRRIVALLLAAALLLLAQQTLIFPGNFALLRGRAQRIARTLGSGSDPCDLEVVWELAAHGSRHTPHRCGK